MNITEGKRSSFPLASAISDQLANVSKDLAAGELNTILDSFTPTTSELLRYWFHKDFCDVRHANFHQGQIAALTHIIYAHEVLNAPSLPKLYKSLHADTSLVSGALGEISNQRHNHPKYAAKMATGTGKTWVLNALMVWSYLNAKAAPQDPRFTKNFLIVAPGLIVYDRLLDSFLGKERDGVRDFRTSDLYTFRELFIPETYRDAVFAFVGSSVTRKEEIGSKTTSGGMIAITNWHRLTGDEDPDFVDEDADQIIAAGVDVDLPSIARSIVPVAPGKAGGNALENLDRRFLRGGPLEALIELNDLMVFNDEAHHIHTIKKGGGVTEVEWQKSLTRIAETKGERFIQVDFSATPYNQVGSGKNTRKEWFPHIVVDYDLRDAMRDGLVKTLAIDRRKSLASLPLDFRAERDESNRVVGLSEGQRTMLRAGLKKLEILESEFAAIDETKRPKMLVICEDTNVTPFVEEFLSSTGLDDRDVLRVDSNAKGEMRPKDWALVRERLFDMDRHDQPKVIVSVVMLREGFDVNNICVIVSLRAAQQPILLEQIIGRGLRLMWRGDKRIDELRAETQARLRKGLEPTHYFDMLFLVEHPSFIDFYSELGELLEEGYIAEVDDEDDELSAGKVAADVERLGLREGFEEFDFHIPIIIRDAEEELREPAISPDELPVSKFGLADNTLTSLKRMIGKGEAFVSEDVQTGKQYGDYRVDGGVLSATGYNDFLSRIANRIASGFSIKATRSASNYKQQTKFPILMPFRPLLVEWLDTYIRTRLFGQEFDPLSDENWRVLLVPDVIDEIGGIFSSALVGTTENLEVEAADVLHRKLSDVDSITVRNNFAISVSRSIYQKLPYPSRSGGLEKLFIEWLEQDTSVEAFCKIHEFRHTMLHRHYLKADGMPARYSPDFIVRTVDDIYIVETKAQSSLSDENVRRKQRAAVTWVEGVNKLEPHQRSDRKWHYVLLGENTVTRWRDNNSSVSDLLHFARLQPSSTPLEQNLFSFEDD